MATKARLRQLWSAEDEALLRELAENGLFAEAAALEAELIAALPVEVEEEESVGFSVPERVLAFRRAFVTPSMRQAEPMMPEGTDLQIWTEYLPLRDGTLRWYLMAFVGRQTKPVANYSFKSKDQLDRYVAQLVTSRRGVFERKAKETQERREWKHDYKVGDILYASWGYDQTNVDFYQVTNVRGAMVDVAPIAGRTLEYRDHYGTAVPDPGVFTGPSKAYRPTEYGVRIDRVRQARKWDGKPMRFSDGH